MPQIEFSLSDADVQRIADAVAERRERAAAGYLNAEQAATYIAAPRSRIHDLSGSGRLSTYRDGRRLLFKRRDLDALLDADSWSE